MAQGQLNLNSANDLFKVNVELDNYVTFQNTLVSGAWATAELTIMVSNDGVNFIATSQDIITAVGITSPVNVSQYKWAALKVTTGEGAAGIVAVATHESQFYPVDPFRTPIYQYLDLVGDGSGQTNATDNYAGAVEEFKIVPAATETFVIHRMIISLSDTKTLAADQYGKNITLANGIEVKVIDSAGDLFDLTNGVPITTNAEWGHLCYDVNVLNFGTNPANEHLVVRWTFDKSGQPLYLRGSKGEYLAVQLHDDLSGLLTHNFLVQGYVA